MISTKTVTLPNGCRYSVHPQHRGQTPRKSQWAISENEEQSVFQVSEQKGWLEEAKGWGLYLQGATPDYLGVSASWRGPVRRLFVARFARKRLTDPWHGYPADHVRSFSDCPSEHVAQLWMEQGFLSLAKLRRLKKGQPCRL